MTETPTQPPVVTNATAAAPAVSQAKNTQPNTNKRKAVAAVKVPVVKTAKAQVAKNVALAAKPAVTPLKKPTPKPSQPAAAAKPAKAKKTKMVRDSMTMPKAEYAVLAELKLRAATLASPVKKTELLRAGIKALSNMSDAGFLVALKAVPSLKTGRPSKS